MSLFLVVLTILASCVASEVAAWLVHRYVMHGWGWSWHRSHHEPHNRRLERNDRYGLVFAALAIALLVCGQYGPAWEPLFWVGIGLCLYGALYAVLHDILVHQRLPLRWQPRSGYLARLVEAHHLHHASRTRDDAVSFGFLYAPPIPHLRARINARRRAKHVPRAETRDRRGRRCRLPPPAPPPP